MSNETILSEVDEELRRDRIRALWRRFGPYLIGAAVAVVLAVAVNEGWAWWQNSNAARSSDQFYAALELAEAGDIPGAQSALQQVETSGSGSYPLLARFRQAALLGREGKTAEAVAAYDALANADTTPRVRELALVLAANVLVDSGDVAAVQQRVGGLVTPDNPLRNAAREAIGLAQYKAGRVADALETFESVAADQQVNQDLVSRIQVYIAQLVAEGATTVAQQAAAANTTVIVDTEDPAAQAPMAATPVEPAAPETPVEQPPEPAAEAPVEAPATPQAPAN